VRASLFLDRTREEKKKANDDFTFATRRMTASRAILISRRRRGRPLNLNLDDATFGKTKIERAPFFARARAPFRVRARACKKTRRKRETSSSSYLFSSSFLMDSKRYCALNQSFGCVCKCVQMCRISPNISRDICNFFFKLNEKTLLFSPTLLKPPFPQKPRLKREN